MIQKALLGLINYCYYLKAYTLTGWQTILWINKKQQHPIACFDIQLPMVLS